MHLALVFGGVHGSSTTVTEKKKRKRKKLVGKKTKKEIKKKGNHRNDTVKGNELPVVSDKHFHFTGLADELAFRFVPFPPLFFEYFNTLPQACESF